jgi:hypothetical protein
VPGAANTDYQAALKQVGKGDQPYGGFYTYTAMHLLGDAVVRAGKAGGDVDGKALIAQLPTATFDSPIGRLAVDRHYVKAPVSVVAYGADGTGKVTFRDADVEPGVSCPAA